jgi:hypothetical protein
MKKALGIATGVALLAAGGCSNAAIREGSAIKAERIFEAQTYTFKGRMGNGSPVKIRGIPVSRSFLDYEDITLVCEENPEAHAEALLLAVGGLGAEQVEYQKQDRLYVEYHHAGMMFGWNTAYPTPETGNARYFLTLSGSYYALAE